MTNNSEINRYYSRPLDVHRWSDHPEATKLRDTIWNQYFKEKFLIGGKGNKAKVRTQEAIQNPFIRPLCCMAR